MKIANLATASAAAWVKALGILTCPRCNVNLRVEATTSPPLTAVTMSLECSACGHRDGEVVSELESLDSVERQVTALYNRFVAHTLDPWREHFGVLTEAVAWWNL